MLKKFLLKYNYPQFLFGKQIRKRLNSLGNNYKIIIDCPCGNGETSFQLSKIASAKIIAADISEEAIKNAKQNFSTSNIQFLVSDIGSVIKTNPNYDAFCLINSLFLFDEAEKILSALKESMTPSKTKLLIIIPNTEGKNFKWFQKQNTNENKFIIPAKEIRTVFEKRNFKVEQIESIAFAHHFNRSDIKLFSVFWSLYLLFLNKIQTAFKIGEPNYFLITLSV